MHPEWVCSQSGRAPGVGVQPEWACTRSGSAARVGVHPEGLSSSQEAGAALLERVSERGRAVRTSWMGFLTSGDLGSSSE